MSVQKSLDWILIRTRIENFHFDDFGVASPFASSRQLNDAVFNLPLASDFANLVMQTTEIFESRSSCGNSSHRKFQKSCDRQISS